MTRINIITPSSLYDQHLMAEYREIFMVPAALRRTLKSKKGLCPAEYPKTYVLGKGHVVFFFDKGKYLEKRYHALQRELKRRGFKLDPNRKFPTEIFKENNLYKDWAPSKKDKALIQKRLAYKVSLKPQWYRKTTTLL